MKIFSQKCREYKGHFLCCHSGAITTNDYNIIFVLVTLGRCISIIYHEYSLSADDDQFAAFHKIVSTDVNLGFKVVMSNNVTL